MPKRNPKKGETALSGEKHEYFNVWLFGESSTERKISCRGKSIMVYDPAKEDEEAYWAGDNIASNTEVTIPAGYVVRVIKAWVVFIDSQAEAA